MNQLNPSFRLASEHDERGGTHGLALIFFLLEQRKLTLALVPVLVAGVLTAAIGGGSGTWVGLTLAIPLVFVGGPLAYLIWHSWTHDDGPADWTPWIEWRNASKGAKYSGRKIPMEVVYEAYMAGELDFKEDVYDTFLRRNRLFRFAFTIGDVMFYIRDFLGQNLDHSVEGDHGDIAHVYNRGNDFYNWFLGETMVYTSGIYQSQDDSLEDAQRRKLDLVCTYTQMKPGDRHLDLGCGWGTLAAHAAKHYGTDTLGVTLAAEQAEWARDVAEKAGVSDRVNILVDDYRNIPSQRFDKITCLEMAEHVGIKNFQKFLLQVRNMLEDDGIFYLQIAGLRRAWQYEDLVWGLFMGKYIFPGADASCPLGFVVSQCERAGFEVHRVENTGVHYSLTIKAWYDNWMKNADAVKAKYGERWFRMWAVFLAWSAIIAAQGSSTVFMVTLTKNIATDKSNVSEDEKAAVAFSRMDRWVGDKPVGTQQ
jgi:cyclopropane fatty-acyl-phospholipid synthase-like methyltransferase